MIIFSASRQFSYRKTGLPEQPLPPAEPPPQEFENLLETAISKCEIPIETGLLGKKFDKSFPTSRNCSLWYKKSKTN
jgi:hypothetical protein